MFTFNKNYKDLEQVAEFLPAFNAAYAEGTAAGRYPYNDSFKGRVPGIGGEDEDTAIYLLQGLRRQIERDAKVSSYLANGYERIEHVNGTERFKAVVLYDDLHGGGRRGVWFEFASARVVAEAQVKATGAPGHIVPKGKRNGVPVNGLSVMVLR